MLCRTASDLYWMARNVERAENTARLIDLTERISLLPERLDPGKHSATAWHRALDALGLLASYAEHNGEVEPQQVMKYLTLEQANPSSIFNTLFRARELGRAQRGAITAEMYQELNTSWLDINQFAGGGEADDGTTHFLDWVKTRAAAFRGVTVGTMGRDEGYRFMQVGTFVERADNTARLLDIKYAQAEDTKVHEARDFIQYYQWSALLQAMSAFETYRKTYRDGVRPLHVAEMMIFHDGMPRSLVKCCDTLLECLDSLAERPGGEAVRQAGALASSLRYGRMADVLKMGMKPFIDDFMQRLDGLTEAIVAQFMTSTDTSDSQSQQTSVVVS